MGLITLLVLGRVALASSLRENLFLQERGEPLAPFLFVIMNKNQAVEAKDIKNFRSNGFFILKNLLPSELLNDIDAEIQNHSSFKIRQGACLEAKDPYLRAFDRIMNLWTFLPRVRQLIFESHIAPIAADLMGVKGIRLSHDQCLYKPPGASSTPIHADQYHWPVSSDNTLTAWIPLQNTPPELGPIRYFAGSHLLDEMTRNDLSEMDSVKLTEYFETSPFPLIEPNFNLGDVGFHYGWTFHSARPNNSVYQRGVLTIVLMEDGIRLVKVRPDFPEPMLTKWCPGCKFGDKLDSKINPQLWSSDAE